MDQQQQPRERSFIRELVPDWRPTREQRLWVIRIVILFVVVLGVLTLISWPFGITLWEWVKILIVPAVIAGGGIWFNRQQQQRELKIAVQRAQDEALQAYLDRMGNLLFDKADPPREVSDEIEVRKLARAHTLTILRRLDPGRKRSVLDFLYEADLIQRPPPPPAPLQPPPPAPIQPPPPAPLQPPQRVIDLGSPDFEYSTADLSKAKLIGAVLRLADLSGPTNGANVSRADLRGADLRGADLSHATLRGADLSGALLSRSELRYADLTGAYLIGTEFTGANLWGAQLSGAYFRRPEGSTQQYADELREAGLPDERIERAIRGQTNLTNAMLNEVRGITNEEVAKQTPLLTNATMPDGQPYEDWLKSKGRGVDGEAGA